jgi:hypothetical protein
MSIAGLDMPSLRNNDDDDDNYDSDNDLYSSCDM